MIARRAGVLGCALLVALAGCSAAPREKPPTNADEKLADDVMDCLLRSDMRPVVEDFVPERKPDLLSPDHVRMVRDYIAHAGDFLGAREVAPPSKHATTTRYFVMTFSKADVALQIYRTDAGKIIHYHLGGVQS